MKNANLAEIIHNNNGIGDNYIELKYWLGGEQISDKIVYTDEQDLFDRTILETALIASLFKTRDMRTEKFNNAEIKRVINS